MAEKRVLLGIVAVVIAALGLIGCGKSESSDSASSSSDAAGGTKLSGVSLEARDAVVAEIGKYWVKRPDGWVSAITSGSSFAPDHFLREFRDLTVEDVEASDLSESDKLNGIEWAGQVTFKKSPCREIGDPGIMLDGVEGAINRPRGQWSQWVDYQPFPVRVQKLKGKWQFNTDTSLMRGTLPTADDFAQAGAK